MKNKHFIFKFCLCYYPFHDIISTMITLTWLGTASILLEEDGEKLLFDPFFRLNKKLEETPADVFCNVDFILNTHPHVDHSCDLPFILKNNNARLFAPPQTIENLSRLGVDIPNKALAVLPNDKFSTRKCEIVVHKSQHINFDLFLVLKTALRVLFTFKIKQAVKLLKLHKKFPMNNQIVAYEINADNKKIFLMGSAGYVKNYQFPENIDILVLPFQGRSDISKYSLKIIEQIKPKTIILDHFDNAYPPITHHIKTYKFINLMKEKYPEINVIQPNYNQSIRI